MKRTIREVDQERGICCITTPDERFYGRRVMVGTEWEKWDYVPSVTWICDAGWPKGVGFYKWLASKGWSDAEAIKSTAGDRGSKVHQGIGALLSGGAVSLDDSFEGRSGDIEELTPDEYACLMSFVEWFQEFKPEVLDFEYTVWNERYNYAGTVDLKCRIGKTVWIIDFKTSADVWPSFELQVSAYKHADSSLPRATKLGILQVGYRRNKTKKWRFTEVADQFGLFLAARKIWAKEMADVKPLQREYPLSLSLGESVKRESLSE